MFYDQNNMTIDGVCAVLSNDIDENDFIFARIYFEVIQHSVDQNRSQLQEPIKESERNDNCRLYQKAILGHSRFCLFK